MEAFYLISSTMAIYSLELTYTETGDGSCPLTPGKTTHQLTFTWSQTCQLAAMNDGYLWCMQEETDVTTYHVTLSS